MSKMKLQNNNNFLLGIGAVSLLVIGALFMTGNFKSYDDSSMAAAGGFNENGYNYGARIFQGRADGVDKVLDNKVWGDATYANDQLVMKWNAAWDACNEALNDDAEACAGAWLNNEWNGVVKNGSGEVWKYKIIWVGSEGVSSPYWKEGGYSIWGNYEVLMDQGIYQDNGPVHLWYTHSTPNGYGGGH
jgi:hypothetical protein